MIPKIEDGNNFGVDVQKSTLADINTIVENNNLFYGQMSTYYISRAKLLTKVCIHFISTNFNLFYIIIYLI